MIFPDCLLKLKRKDYKTEKEGLMENQNCGKQFQFLYIVYTKKSA